MGLCVKPLSLRNLSINNNLDTMLVSETKFQGNPIMTAYLVLCNVLRSPTVGGHPSGGTAVYVRNGLNATLGTVSNALH